MVQATKQLGERWRAHLLAVRGRLESLNGSEAVTVREEQSACPPSLRCGTGALSALLCGQAARPAAARV